MVYAPLTSQGSDCYPALNQYSVRAPNKLNCATKRLPHIYNNINTLILSWPLLEAL